MRKQVLLLLLFLGSLLFSSAQFPKLPGAGSAFTDSLSRIVHDFKKNFYPIQGSQLTSQVMADVYRSKVGMPGAAHCIIQRYRSEEDTTASWQAIMYDGEIYEEALKIYKNTIKQLKKVRLKIGENSPASFSGEMEIPDETLSFTVTPLRLNSPDTDYKDFCAEVEITNNYDGWVVHLNLHKKKRDDVEY